MQQTSVEGPLLELATAFLFCNDGHTQGSCCLRLLFCHSGHASQDLDRLSEFDEYSPSRPFNGHFRPSEALAILVTQAYAPDMEYLKSRRERTMLSSAFAIAAIVPITMFRPCEADEHKQIVIIEYDI